MENGIYHTSHSTKITFIFQLISCSCKKGCVKRCGCAKVGLKCSTMCSNCHGQGCLNSLVEEELPEDNPIIA